MARKKARRQQKSLRLSRGEVWEVGRRPLSVHVDELSAREEQPEILLAVQAQEDGGVVLVEPISSATPPTALADFVQRAMRQPLIGKPRCPQVVRLSTEADASLLTTPLANTKTALEVAETLPALDATMSQLEAILGGMSTDYRAQAAQAGEPLSEAGLREFFRAARAFYRTALWEIYDDARMFEIVVAPGSPTPETRYGILMGSMGEEFGLALFPTLEDLQRFYEVSLEHLKDMGAPAHTMPPMPEGATAELLQVPALSLSYTAQSELPPSLLQELQTLKLPVANRSAFPLVMSTGQGSMRLARPHELAHMYVAVQAILGWEKHIDDITGDEDDLDVPVTTQIRAVPDFVPALTVQAILRENPCEEDEPDEASLDELKALFETLLENAPRQSPARGKKKAPGDKAGPKGKPATRSNKVYTLAVYLVGGPISSAYADQEVSRRIEIRGDQTLHDLHQAIFQAFDRLEQHLYEFNLGTGPADRSRLYFYDGGWGDGDDDYGDPEDTTLDEFDLQEGQRFGYTFDMGDQWEHVIDVVDIQEPKQRVTYPRVVKRVGTAPPQYPDDEDDEE